MTFVAWKAPLVRTREAKVWGIFLNAAPPSVSDHTCGKAASTLTSDSASPVQSKLICQLSFSRTCLFCRIRVSRPKFLLRSLRVTVVASLLCCRDWAFSVSSAVRPTSRCANAVSHLCQCCARFFAISQYESMAQDALPRSLSCAFDRMNVPSSRSAHGEIRRSCISMISLANVSMVIETWAVNSFCGPVMSMVCFW